jgi:hypothetical protein
MLLVTAEGKPILRVMDERGTSRATLPSRPRRCAGAEVAGRSFRHGEPATFMLELEPVAIVTPRSGSEEISL